MQCTCAPSTHFDLALDDVWTNQWICFRLVTVLPTEVNVQSLVGDPFLRIMDCQENLRQLSSLVLDKPSKFSRPIS